ncbi:hypothetical protein Hypma_004252 [Hypsizygus marmoreus]|uniref:Uncharacterized protein n=1 Tax=Hypsizygus marmoreus TaxID=39966 RepID=A0A369J0E7_HYPMA|nr:hypothetical protein Hypma_004252 [Hypsizygus marmoreus]
MNVTRRFVVLKEGWALTLTPWTTMGRPSKSDAILIPISHIRLVQAVWKMPIRCVSVIRPLRENTLSTLSCPVLYHHVYHPGSPSIVFLHHSSFSLLSRPYVLTINQP